MVPSPVMVLGEMLRGCLQKGVKLMPLLGLGLVRWSFFAVNVAPAIPRRVDVWPFVGRMRCHGHR